MTRKEFSGDRKKVRLEDGRQKIGGAAWKEIFLSPIFLSDAPHCYNSRPFRKGPLPCTVGQFIFSCSCWLRQRPSRRKRQRRRRQKWSISGRAARPLCREPMKKRSPIHPRPSPGRE